MVARPAVANTSAMIAEDLRRRPSERCSTAAFAAALRSTGPDTGPEMPPRPTSAWTKKAEASPKTPDRQPRQQRSEEMADPHGTAHQRHDAPPVVDRCYLGGIRETGQQPDRPAGTHQHAPGRPGARAAAGRRSRARPPSEAPTRSIIALRSPTRETSIPAGMSKSRLPTLRSATSNPATGTDRPMSRASNGSIGMRRPLADGEQEVREIHGERQRTNAEPVGGHSLQYARR